MNETRSIPSLVDAMGRGVSFGLPGSDSCVREELLASITIAALTALEWLELAVLLVGTELALLHVNRAGAALLKAGDGLRLVGARLVCDRHGETATLLQLVAGAVCPGSTGLNGPVTVSRAPGRRALSVSAAPLATAAPGARHRGPAAVIFINDPEMTRPASCAQLARLYGLTAAEARTAAALLDHAHLADVAGDLKVSLATVRTLLQRAFDKTGTHSQAELVQLMLAHRLPAAPAAES